MMDNAVKHLTRLVRSGAITPQTYAECLNAITENPPIPAPRQRSNTIGDGAHTEETPGERPIPPSRRRRAPRDAQLAEETPGERPIPPPRRQRAPRNAQLAEETPGERPIPPPRRRRALRGVPLAEGTLGERQLEFHRTRWTVGAYLRGWQMDVPQGHPHGADPWAFLEGVRPQIRVKLEEEIEAERG